MGSRDSNPQPSPIVPESEQSDCTMSIRTYQFKCRIPRTIADELNQESARIYNDVMVEHWRIYRKQGIWLKQGQAEKLNDHYDAETDKLLHSHSIDAAQQGFLQSLQTSSHQTKTRG